MIRTIDFVFDPVDGIVVPLRDFRIVRAGDTAQSIAAERAAERAEWKRRSAETRERIIAECMNRGMDLSTRGMFDNAVSDCEPMD